MTLRVVLRDSAECAPKMRRVLEAMRDGIRLGMFSSALQWDPGWMLSASVDAEGAQVSCVVEVTQPSAVTVELVQGILRAPIDAAEGLPAAAVQYDDEWRPVGEYDGSLATPGIDTEYVSSPPYLDRMQPVSVWIELQSPTREEQRQLLLSGLEAFETIAGEAPFRGQCQQELSAIGATQIQRVADGTFVFWSEAIAAPDEWVVCLANFLRHNRLPLGFLRARIEQ